MKCVEIADILCLLSTIVNPMIRQLTPWQFMTVIGCGFLLIATLIFWHMTEQPWLGVRFAMSAEQGDAQIGLVVAHVAQDGPAAEKLATGQRVLLLTSENRQVLLGQGLLSSSTIFPTHAQFNHYLEKQQWVADMLATGSVTFLLEDGQSVPITLASSHPLSAIPWIYFLYLIAGFFGSSVGLLTWYFRRAQYASRFVLVAGIGMLLYYLSVVLQYRELALAAHAIKVTTATSMIGLSLFAWGYLAVFMVYPVQICRKRWVWLVLAITLLIALNETMQWFEWSFYAHLAYVLLIGVTVYFLFFLQWRATQRYPIERVIIRLLVMFMVVTTVVALLLWIIPLLLQEALWMPHELLRLIFVPIALGWAIAIFRYRLFNVERWWYVSILWLISVIIVLTPYTLLVYLLEVKPLTALSLTLLSVVFFYVPLEQSLNKHIGHVPATSVGVTASELLQTLQTAGTDKDFQAAWLATIERRFQPVVIKRLARKCEKVRFDAEGIVMYVPEVAGEGGYELNSKQQGSWLFNSQDVQVAQALFDLISAVLNASHAREEATFVERTRIMRDLHDSLGAKLLTMTQRCRGTVGEDYAREALQTLRDTVHLSSMAEQLDLSALLGEWRLETRERLELADAALHWQVEGIAEGLHINSAKILLLRSFLRETVSNALKHAQPKHVYVRLWRENDCLTLCVGNDGIGNAPTVWKAGFGLSHLRERVLRAGGQLAIVRRSVTEVGDIDEIQASIFL